MASCTNCGGKLLRGATSCPHCGIFTGEESEGQAVPKRSYAWLWIVLVIVVIIAAASALLLRKPELIERATTTTQAPIEPPSTRVVKDRPGGARRGSGTAINEAQATRLLRTHLVASGAVTNDCLVAMSNGFRDTAYRFTAYNRCDGTRLGRWEVDGKTSAVTRAPASSP